MIIEQMNENAVISDIRDFRLSETLECGQCFNFRKLDEERYLVIAMGKAKIIEYTGDQLIFMDTSTKEVNEIWLDYFDLNRDYGKIKEEIIKIDGRLNNVISENSGIRILNQDFFETLISFIISQNKQIPQIKSVVRNISEMAGSKVVINDEEVYLFPSISELKQLTEDDIRACKAGFRAPYIMDAVKKVDSNEVSLEKLNELSTDDARKLLMTIKGVGEKVANCVLLFSLGRREAFPVDVWMKRIMENMYLHEDTKKEIIEKYATEKFGELSGYAQQYLFIYGKDNKIGQ